MGAPTGRRRCSASSASMRARLPVASAVPSRRLPSSYRTTSTKASGGDGKVRSSRRRDAAVTRRMEALRRLVPTSYGDQDDELLLLSAAAGYIARLQAQVRVMQLMANILEHAQG